MKNLLIILLMVCSFSIKASELDSLLYWSASNHPKLKAAFKSYEASLQKVHGSGYLPDPTFSFGYFISSAETRLGPQEGSFGIQQMFPWRGTLKAQKSIAIAHSKMEFEKFQLLKLELFKNVKQLYFESEKLAVNTTFLQENVRLLNQIKTIGLSKIEAGNGSTTDILRINLAINNLETRIATHSIMYSAKTEQLALIIARDTVILHFQNNDGNFRETLSADSINNHPMVEASREKLIANLAQKKIIHQMGLPKLGIGLNYIVVGERTDMNPVDNGKDILMPKVSMSLPIYRKKYKALAKMNELQRESIEEEVKNKKLILDSKLIVAQAQINSANERIVLYRNQIQTAKSLIELLKSDYQNGNTIIEAIFSTQAQLVMYQMELQKAETDLKIANSELEFILNKTV